MAIDFNSDSTWNNTKGQREFYIHFHDGLAIEDVACLMPCKVFRIDHDNQILSINEAERISHDDNRGQLIYQRRRNKYYSYAEAIEDHQVLYAHIERQDNTHMPIDELVPVRCQHFGSSAADPGQSRFMAVVFVTLVITLVLIALANWKQTKISVS